MISQCIYLQIICSLHRKHHCQVHYIGTNTLMLDQRLKASYHPTSDYMDTFHPIQNVRMTKRGLAIPAQIFPKSNPCQPMDTLSTNRKDFVEKPLVATMVLPKMKGSLSGPSKMPFQDATSYKIDYPRRRFDPNPMAESLMRTTLPRIIEVGPEDNYCTTNQKCLKEWNGNKRQEGYKELQEKPFFVGNIQTESLMRNDYDMKNGKPSTSCKKIETHLSNGNFDGKTMHQIMYTLPPLPQQRVVFSKNQTKVQLETMAPNQEGAELLTQYQRDSCKLPKHTMRRCFCPPEPDKLSLFGGNFDHKTENKSSYVELGEVPQPRMSFKNSQVLSTNPMEGAGGKFYDTTTMNLHYQPVSSSVQASGVRDTKNTHFRVCQNSKGSQYVKDSQDFGVGFTDKTVNQSEYFQFCKVPLREFHGDKAERVYYPSMSKFDMKSETKSRYDKKEAKPAESFKPLDSRFKKNPPLYSRKMAAESCYKSDFVPVPLPKPELCPAEQLLKQA